MDTSSQSKKTDVVQSESSACLDDLVCQKILAEKSGSVVQVVADSTVATGWIGPDGRVLTDWHVLWGKRSATAITPEGKAYPLGKDIAIDDVHDIVALGFVDKGPQAKGLELSDKTPVSGDAAVMLSHPHGGSLHLSLGSFRGAVDQGAQIDGTAGKKQWFENYLSRVPASVRTDVEQFHRRPVDVYTLAGAPGSSGGPIFDRDGKVSGLLDMGNYVRKGDIGAVPVKFVDALLKQTPEQRKFDVRSGYESGLNYFVNRTISEDNLHRTVHIGAMAGGLLGLGKMAVAPHAGKLASLAGTGYLAFDSYSNYEELKSSSNWRDSLHGSLAAGGDFLVAAGLTSKIINKAGTLRTVALATGLALRAGSELVPNHYAIKSIQRKDGSADSNLWDFMFRHKSN